MELTGPYNPAPIVVGIERSERSLDGLAFARTVARTVEARLVLVAVYPVGARTAAVSGAPAEEAQATLEWAARSVGDVRAELRALPDTSVARGLQRVAEEASALAIVVGPSHRGPVGRLVPGSGGERLLREAPCPVGVAPRGYASEPDAEVRSVGVGYVDTAEAIEALGAAVGIAARTGGEVHAMSVVEPPPVTVGKPFGWNYRELEARAHDDLNRTLRHAILEVPAPVGISANVVAGYADDELARLSEEVDLLVCGARRHGPIGRAMLGSVSAGVLRKARCPVLVVPRGARDGFAALVTPRAAAEVGHA